MKRIIKPLYWEDNNMSNTTDGVMISQLERADSLLGSDLLEVERGGQSVAVIVDELINYIGIPEFIKELENIIG